MADAEPSTALFTYTDALCALRDDRLVGLLQTWANNIVMSDDYLWSALRAAEADAERRLRVFFSTTEIIPTGDTDPATETRTVEEPGYDYDTGMFAGERWGLLTTRHHPIISITSIKFAYPTAAASTLWQVPSTWIRADKKYGRINIVPASDALVLPLNTFILSALGAGRNVPLMIRIRYKAGLSNAATDYPDLVEMIYQMTALRLLNSLYLPGSGSISADGLSRSVSFEAQKYQDRIDHSTDALRSAFHGIRLDIL